MPMTLDQISAVSARINGMDAQGNFTYPIMGAVGPEERALDRIATLLMAYGMPSEWLTMIAVQFSLRRGGNPPAVAACAGSTCAVRGRLAVQSQPELMTQVFGASVPPADDVIRALVIAANFTPELQMMLGVAEVQPGDLDSVRAIWVADAQSQGFPGVSDADIESAADGVTYSVGLGAFVPGQVWGCKGQTCPPGG